MMTWKVQMMSSTELIVDGKILDPSQEKMATSEDGEFVNITGCAGSGKTLVLLARIIKLAKTTEDTILYLVYTRSVADRISRLLINEGIPEGRVDVRVMHSFSKEIYGKVCPEIRVEEIDPRDPEAVEWMASAISEAKMKSEIHGLHFSSRLSSLRTDDWIDECSWMANMGIGFEDTGLDLLRTISRDSRNKILYSSDEDRMLSFLVYQMYNRILMNRGEVSRSNRISVGFCIPEYYSLQALNFIDRAGPGCYYDHIFLDEAQDVTRTEVMLSIKLHRKSLYIASDANQCVFGKKWSFDDLIPGKKLNVKKLKKTFRCTKSIDRFAESLRSHNDYLLSESESFDHMEPDKQEGDMPTVICFRNRDTEKKYLVKSVKKEIAEYPDHRIGILCTTGDLCSDVGKAFINAGMKPEYVHNSGFDSDTPGIKISTVHSAKGLEFTTVYMPFFDVYAYDRKVDRIYSDSYNELKQRDTVYVAMTRAEANLFITYGAKNGRSRYLSEIDPTLYSFEDKTGTGVSVPEYAPPKIKFNISDAETRPSPTAEAPKKPERRGPVTREYVKEVLDKLDIRYEDKGNLIFISDKLTKDKVEAAKDERVRLCYDKNNDYWYYRGACRTSLSVISTCSGCFFNSHSQIVMTVQPASCSSLFLHPSLYTFFSILGIQ